VTNTFLSMFILHVATMLAFMTIKCLNLHMIRKMYYVRGVQ